MTKANAPVDVLRETRPSEDFRTWLYNNPAAPGQRPELVSPATVAGLNIATVRGRAAAVSTALDGDLYVSSDQPNDRTMVAVQLVSPKGVQGVLLSISERPQEVQSALQAVAGQRLTALVVSVLVAGLIGFLVASLITSRVKRLAAAAGELAEGHLDTPMYPSGRDEIGDLGRTLDSMRIALAETFDALSSERDRLSAIFTSLDEAVIVVDPDGDVRFANPASSGLIGEDGMVVDALRPWIRRATHRGSAESDHVAIGERVFAIGARYLPAERSALLVVRDRTDELRRDQAEREFVSNAAHELRNPIAGMSGAIEVLRSGAKDDPEARDHFLDRLATDVDRVSRLTRALLTLARMEAIGEGEADVVSVDIAISRGDRRPRPLRRRGRPRDRDRARPRRERGSRAAPAGADRAADERVQAHPRSRHRYASRASRGREQSRHRGRGHRNWNPRGREGPGLRSLLPGQRIARARGLRIGPRDRQADGRRDGRGDQRLLGRGPRQYLHDQTEGGGSDLYPDSVIGAQRTCYGVNE